jgi:hypothetical protein
MLKKPASSSNRANELFLTVRRFRRRMPAPCSRYRRGGIECLIDIRLGRYKNCNDNYKSCDLRVTFKKFERLSRKRAEYASKSATL